jgi:hypothetical protein
MGQRLGYFRPERKPPQRTNHSAYDSGYTKCSTCGEFAKCNCRGAAKDKDVAKARKMPPSRHGRSLDR